MSEDKTTPKTRTYIAIDLKSFYASVECRERGLDPLTTNLVVADTSRTSKTICLAVTPALKTIGVPGRPRLFEVEQIVGMANALRLEKIPDKTFKSSSTDAVVLQKEKDKKIDFLIAPPQMATYMQYSTEIYQIYLKYIAPEDIHVYSIDEVFMDVTHYLKTYEMTAHDLAKTMIQDVLKQTGITATAGIGTNLYLAKIAMDIGAKHVKADKDGVRIAELNEVTYRKKMWNHEPLTDFWRVGKGCEKKLLKISVKTMGDIAKLSMNKDGEDTLYRLFGVNAELLIDHAWGIEPCTIEMIKAYKPESESLGSGQVLTEPYPYDKAKLIVKEMAELLSLDLVRKNLVTDQLVLRIGYDKENMENPDIMQRYQGEFKTDHYGRTVPKHAQGTINLKQLTASTKAIVTAAADLFDQIANPILFVRRVTLNAGHVVNKDQVAQQAEQLDMFTDYQEQAKQRETAKKEEQLQNAILSMKTKYGKNAIVKGMNLQEGGTTQL